MAFRELLLLTVLLFIIGSQVSSEEEMGQHEVVEGTQQSMTKGPNRRLMEEIDCGGLCGKRCSLHSRPNTCNRACGTCCMRCKCVPPGTAGNREVCGSCYTNMLTHGNKTKCP